MNTPQILNAVKIWAADCRYLRIEDEIFILKLLARSQADWWRSVVTPETQLETERYLPLSCLFLMRKNSALSAFTDNHDWTEAKHISKLFSAAAVTWCKGHIQPTIISIEMMRNCVSRDHASKWSGREGKGQRTRNWPLVDSKRDIKLEGQTITRLDHMTSVSQRSDLSPSSAFLANPNRSLLKRIEWSMVSKVVEKSSQISAVTLPSFTDYRISP